MAIRYFLIFAFLQIPCFSITMELVDHIDQGDVKCLSTSQDNSRGEMALSARSTISKCLVEMFLNAPMIVVQSRFNPEIVRVKTTDGYTVVAFRTHLQESQILKNSIRYEPGVGCVIHSEMDKHTFNKIVKYLRQSAAISAVEKLIGESDNAEIRALFQDQLKNEVTEQMQKIDKFSYKEWRQYVVVTKCLRIDHLRRIALAVGRGRKFLVPATDRETIEHEIAAFLNK